MTYTHESRTLCFFHGDHCQETDDDGYCNKCGDGPIGDDFDDFVAMTAEVTALTTPKWRNGQAAFNTLHGLRPDIANKLRGTPMDPFHRDDTLPIFYKYVERNW